MSLRSERLAALRLAVSAALFAATCGHERRVLRRHLDMIDRATSRRTPKPSETATTDRRASPLPAGQGDGHDDAERSL